MEISQFNDTGRVCNNSKCHPNPRPHASGFTTRMQGGGLMHPPASLKTKGRKAARKKLRIALAKYSRLIVRFWNLG